MHPILGDQLRLRLHLTAWGLAGAIVALLIRVLVGVPWTEAFVFGIPMGLVAAPISLSAWYLCKAMPLARTSALRIGATAFGAAVVTASLWAGLGRLWWQLLGQSGFDLPAQTAAEPFALLIGLGALGYLLAITVHYVMQASQESAAAERRALESQVAQREAELRALRAQIDPHFLFNSLNSIIGLMSADADRARTMCHRLAEFLRDSLTLGGETRIPLSREAALVEQYLGVERVRFGTRLNAVIQRGRRCGRHRRAAVDPAAAGGECRAPRGGHADRGRRDPGRSHHRRSAAVHRGVESIRSGLAPARHWSRPRERPAPAGRHVRRAGGNRCRSRRRPVPLLSHDSSGNGDHFMSAPDTPMRIMIVDDEEPARMALRALLVTMPDVTLVSECQNGFDAVKALADARPDVVLLDVQMPKLDGFEVLELMGRMSRSSL